MSLTTVLDGSHPLYWSCESCGAGQGQACIVRRTGKPAGWDHKSRTEAVRLWERYGRGYEAPVPNPLLTPEEAAQLVGVTSAGLRSIAAKARRDGRELLADRSLWPDQRSARYVRQAVERYRAATPSRTRTRKEI